ncbi:DNA gyrase subunit A [Chitinophaga sp.]|uniref:DNA gyrase subunit A n=1 Tax=Chitinophaga sp. TaxID=1869181 RepID=UPI0031DC2908
MSENTENSQEGRIVQINIEEQMKTAYIDYSMSVIVGRALPDVRDGLKPVHRRVLFGMSELGNNSNKPYKKSARIVGEVMGKYHPHGDASIYDTIVRLAQPWTLRYILVDGQGNFGSVDGDAPAAMRYTEIRLQKIAEAMLEDIDKETVDFTLNFDDTLEEPSVLPTRIPNLLVNGASGIAVGMATNIMPHNLSEVVDGLIAYIENKEITSEDLIKYVKAPDFPTGGIIYGYEGVKQGFETGRGRVVVRGKVNVETTKAGRERLVIYELPYQINKAVLHQKIAQLADDKIIEGIAEVRDESDREGMRLVIDLKREAIANVVINQLYKYSELQTSYGINNVALVKGRPRVLALKDLLAEFVDFRHEVVVRRTRFDLRKAEEKAHILQGYLIALDHLDEVIALIRGSRTPDEAKDGLMSQFGLSEIQSKAILELRLQRLTGMERDKIKEEYEEIMKLISYLKDVLNDESLRFKIIREELEDVKKRFGDERKTEIQYLASEMRMEDIIAEEDVVITISHLGYIKRTSAYDYRQQKRGGRGALGGKTREEDYIEHLFVASTHHTMLFFTEKGRCYWLKVYEIPEGEKSGKGRAIQNLINLPTDDKIRAIIDIKDLGDKDFINSHYIVLCTSNGIIKKTLLEEFSRPRQNGVNAITINEGDQLLEAKLTNGNSEIMMAIKSGRAIRFPENTVRDTGRGAIGVRGIEVDNDKDEVVGMICVNKDENRTVLVVSENGFGKRTDIEEYRITNRGGKGVKTINVTEKTGRLIAILDVTEKDDLMITCKSGITIRMAVADIREAGRATQGVRLIRLDDTDQIAAVARLDEQEEQEVEQDLENIEQEIAQQEISDAAATSGEDVTDEDQAGDGETPNE